MPKEIWVPAGGWLILVGPGAWLKALGYGTRRQRLSAIPIALIVLLATSVFIIGALGGEGVLMILAIGAPIVGLAVLSWHMTTR